MSNIFVKFDRSDLGLRWSSHKRHCELLKEFYFHNKYYLTEQMKDTILDAIDCLNAVEKLTEMSKEEQYIDTDIARPGYILTKREMEAIKNGSNSAETSD